MSFLIKDNELLVIYNEICDTITNSITNTIKKGVCGEPVYNKNI